MTEEQIKNPVEILEGILGKLESKDFGIYFFTLDTKGNPTAGVANIYEHVKVLIELGYNAYILHEKNDYKLIGDAQGKGLADWLGDEYAALPHVSIEKQDLKITPQDFLVIPEIFVNVMDQVKTFPCRKIVLSQSYAHLLELLPIGSRWANYGFTDAITTSDKQANYLKILFPTLNTKVVPVSIPPYFKPSDKPKIPVVTIVSREQSDALKVAKSFYLQYPLYKWITFKELRGLSRVEFAEELGKSCIAVWVDEKAGFGTFPIEAMESDTIVIGKIPDMVPEWMEAIDANGNTTLKNNGSWTRTTLEIPELIVTHLKLWLDDTPPVDMIETAKELKGVYSEEAQRAKIEEVYGKLVEERKEEIIKQLEVVNNPK